MKQIIRLSGKAHQVFIYLRSIARAYGKVTMGELMKGKE